MNQEKFKKELETLAMPGFPMIPIGDKVVIRVVPMKDYVVNGILMVEATPTPGGKAVIGEIMAMGREIKTRFPYLEPGQKIFFNHLVGNNLRLNYGGKMDQYYVINHLGLESQYFGTIEEFNGGESAENAPLTEAQVLSISKPDTMVN